MDHKTKKKPRISINSEYRSADVVVGGAVNLSVDDAKKLYSFTELVKDVEANELMYVECRIILRRMAKEILIAGIPIIEDRDKFTVEFFSND